MLQSVDLQRDSKVDILAGLPDVSYPPIVLLSPECAHVSLHRSACKHMLRGRPARIKAKQIDRECRPKLNK